jgi:hypothetical protein
MNRRDTARLASDTAALSGRNGEEAPAGNPAPEIDDAAISALISFFQLLDEWDREAKQQ